MPTQNTPLRGEALNNRAAPRPSPAEAAKEEALKEWKRNTQYTFYSPAWGQGAKAGADAWYRQYRGVRVFVNADGWETARKSGLTFTGMLSLVKPVVFEFLEYLCQAPSNIMEINISSMYRTGSAASNPHASGLAIDLGLIRFFDASKDFNFYRVCTENTEGREPAEAAVIRAYIARFRGLSQYISPWFIKGIYGEQALLPGEQWSKNLLNTVIGKEHHNHLHLSFQA